MYIFFLFLIELELGTAELQTTNYKVYSDDDSTKRALIHVLYKKLVKI